MLWPVIIVDVEPPGRSSELVAVLVEACTESLTSTECIPAGRRSEHRTTRARARITFQGPREQRVRIELDQQEGDRVVRRVTTLSFRPMDDRAERWRAVGHSVAALAVEPTIGGASEAGEDVPEEARCGEKPACNPQSETDSLGPSPFSWRFAGGSLLGSGLDDGVWRLGAGARGSLALGAFPLFATAAASWSARESDVPIAAQWVDGSVGLGASWRTGGPRLDAFVEILGERLSASAVDPVTGASSTGARWLSGLQASLAGVWPDQGWIGGTAGFGLRRLNEGTGVRVAGQRVAGTPGVGWLLGLGVELRIPSTPAR